MHGAGLVRKTAPWLVVAGLCWLSACSDDDDDSKGTSELPASTDGSVADGGRASDGGTTNGGTTDSGARDGGTTPPASGCPVMVNEANCDRTKRPIVFVHGTSANADSFAHPAMLLASNGYCADRIVGLEYNSLFPARGDGGIALPPIGGGAGLDGGVTPLDAGSSASDSGAGDAGTAGFLNPNYLRAKAAIDEAIEKLRRETGTDKVDLLGHSQGAGHGSRYAGENPDKVARYVNLAGGQLAANPGGVPTMCLSSLGDRPVNCGTTKNVIIQDYTVDHSAVSSSTEAFVEIYKFFNDNKEPKYREIQCGDPIILEGRGPTLGDNTFLPGSKIEVFEVGSEPRTRGTPVKVFELGADGNFGPWEAKRGVAYEFKLVPPKGDTARTRVIRNYFRPFTRSNRLMRFNFQTLDPSAGATGNMLPLDDGRSVVIPRRLQKAFLYPRDSLKIDGFEVVSAANTVNPTNGRSMTIAALYLFDKAPFDNMSTGEPIVRGTFVSSADVYMQAMTPAFINVTFKEATTDFTSTIKVPNWPSSSEGVSVVFVD